jgi:flavin-dependent dehydrogenase
MYDAIVIGARCAGAATAMLLARQGHRVLLLDRGVFPSEVHQGHFIHKHGPGRLADWGLLEKVVATNCPPITTHVTDFGDFPLIGRGIRLNNVAWGYAPRRRQLDQVLVHAALESGVEFRPNFLVEGCLWQGDRVEGIRGRDHSQGTICAEKARITIAADGKHSAFARAVGAPSYEQTPSLTCWYFSYWSGVLTEGFEWYLRKNRVIFSFLTTDNLFAIFIGWPIHEFDSVKADIEGHFMQVVDLIPDFSGRVRSGRREERFYGTADVPNFLRRPFGPGWALVGDAGCHKDPMMGLGICDAFRDADFLSCAVHEGLTGERPFNEALMAYESRRNEATMADYRENISQARFEPVPDELLDLRAALRGNPEDTNRFIMAHEGLIPHEEFFNSENLRRIHSKSATQGQACVSSLPANGDTGRLRASRSAAEAPSSTRRRLHVRRPRSLAQ